MQILTPLHVARLYKSDISLRKMDLSSTSIGHLFKMPNFPPTRSSPIRHVSCKGNGRIMPPSSPKHQTNDEVESPLKLRNSSNHGSFQMH